MLDVSECTYTRPGDLPGKVASHLAAGQLSAGSRVALSLGRAPSEPARSADPRPESMKDTLNARGEVPGVVPPFAPAVLAERCGELFEGDHASPYMLEVMKTRPNRVKDVAAGPTSTEAPASRR